MLSEIIEITKFLIEKIGAWWNAPKEERIKTIKRTLEEVIEPTYKKLEAIHQDYTKNLSALREHLATQSLPPRELIAWLRNAGLEYRKDREFLSTIEVELLRFSGKKVDPTSDNAAAVYSGLQAFINAVMEYYHRATRHNEVSFYRDFENQLTAILHVTESVPGSAGVCRDQFYASSEIQDMQKILLTLCDCDLPKAWTEVCTSFRIAMQCPGKT